MSDKDTPMQGFYEVDPNAGEFDEPIHLYELLFALETSTKVLQITIDDNDSEQNEGLANAVRILASLLKARWTGWDVIRKPSGGRRNVPPRTPKQQPSGNIVSMPSSKGGAG